MFFEMELMTRSAVGSAWRAGHRLPAGESAHLQRICQELGAMLTIEDRRSRMSQRTGSILVSGAARLYKEKADAVLKDTSSFMLSITSGGPRRGRSGPEPSSSSDTGSEDTPPGDGGETQLVPASGTLRTSTGPAPLIAEEEVRRKSRKRVTTVFPTPDGWTDASRNRNSEENNGESSASRETGAGPATAPAAGRRHAAVQTEELERSLPYAVMHIYDTFDSPVPSKILVCSISPAARDL